jgi:ATP-dependent Clp protease ATP-binding subunit ClpB
MLLCTLIVQVKKELDDLRDKLQPLTMKYRKEKERIDEIRKLKQRREELQFSLQEAERRMDLARVADIKYGALQEIDVAIARLEGETGENLMLTENVGPEQIAEVRVPAEIYRAMPIVSLELQCSEMLFQLGRL